MTDVFIDHDLLITLKANFDTFQSQYTLDMKELKDGTQFTLSDHEKRIKVVEEIVQVTTPVESLKQFKTLQQEVHDFKTTANAFRLIAGLVGGAIMYLLTQIPNLIRQWGIKI